MYRQGQAVFGTAACAALAHSLTVHTVQQTGIKEYFPLQWAQGVDVGLSLQQATLTLHPAQQLTLTSLRVGLGAAGKRQQLVRLESLRLLHAHRTAGLAWLHDPAWQLDRLSCSLGPLEVSAREEGVDALLLPLLRRRGKPPKRSGGSPGAGTSAETNGGGARGRGAGLLRRLPQEVGALVYRRIAPAACVLGSWRWLRLLA